MQNLGKKIRLNRLFNQKSNKIVGIAMDHGIDTPAEKGLASIGKTIGEVTKAGADAVMINRGIVKNVFSEYAEGKTSIIFKLGGGTRTFPGKTVRMATAEEALSYGADMGSCGFIMNTEYDTENFQLISELSKECETAGLPFMVHAYARGNLLPKEKHLDPKELKLAVRVAVEAGADIIKTSYPGTIEGFQEVFSVCPLPIVVAGGHSKLSDEDFLKNVKDVITAGAMGVMVGTNCWLNKNPSGIVKALIKIVHENSSVEEAIKEL